MEALFVSSGRCNDLVPGAFPPIEYEAVTGSDQGPFQMPRRRFLALATAGGASFLPGASGAAQANEDSATPANGSASEPGGPQIGYAAVNGLQMYYEILGEGEPLMLLHGAFGTIATWGPLLGLLAESRQVITVEFQGHGHTADVDRPLTYEQLADDVVALMGQLNLDQADIAGYSMGGNVALQVAIRHPDVVRKLVIISGTYRSDGEYPEVLAGVQALNPDFFVGTPIEESYRQAAPNPEDFSVLVEKVKTLLTTEFSWPETDVESIAAPAQLVIGDSDTVRPEHVVQLFRLLGGGVAGDFFGLPRAQLAVIPATTHETIISERADQLATIVQSFLDARTTEAG
jgi:pimeloyl-ACP methyl ester carboxylesterase